LKHLSVRFKAVTFNGIAMQWNRRKRKDGRE